MANCLFFMYAESSMYLPVTLILTSSCFSLDAWSEERFVTTPLFTAFGRTVISLL